MGDFGEALDIDDVAGRIADRLAEHRLGVLVDELLEALEIGLVGHADLDALARERVHEQVVGAAVELADRDDVVTDAGDGLDRVGDGRHAGGDAEAGNAALHLGDARFEHGSRRVHDAGVDVAGDRQVEQVGAVLGVVEGVRRGLVDRHGGGLGGRFGRVAMMERDGFELHVVLPWCVVSHCGRVGNTVRAWRKLLHAEGFSALRGSGGKRSFGRSPHQRRIAQSKKPRGVPRGLFWMPIAPGIGRFRQGCVRQATLDSAKASTSSGSRST